MNIFFFELKAQLKSFFSWTVFVLIALFVFMEGIYPVFQESLADVLKVLEGLPPAFTAAFGFDVSSMFSYEGFYSFAFNYIGLIGAIMAAVLAVSTFAKEKRAKCTDFLLTKPISREHIFLSKLLSTITVLMGTNSVYIAVSAFLYIQRGEDTAVLGTFLLSSCALFLTQLVFLALGIFYAVFEKRIRSVSGAATIIGFTGFILSALVNLFKEEAIRFIAPLKYFDPASLFINGNFEIRYAATALTVSILCIALSYVRFCKKDAHAV